MKDEEKRDLPERTFNFACRVVNLCQAMNDMPGIHRPLMNQLLRSATSIGANVEEGQASQSRADFTAKYYIACKEARETHYWLRLLASTDVIPKAKLIDLTDEANQLVAILTSIVKKCRIKRKGDGEEYM